MVLNVGNSNVSGASVFSVNTAITGDLQRLASVQSEFNLALNKQNRGNRVESSSAASDSQTVTSVRSSGCSHNACRLSSHGSAPHTHTHNCIQDFSWHGAL